MNRKAVTEKERKAVRGAMRRAADRGGDPRNMHEVQAKEFARFAWTLAKAK